MAPSRCCLMDASVFHSYRVYKPKDPCSCVRALTSKHEVISAVAILVQNLSISNNVHCCSLHQLQTPAGRLIKGQPRLIVHYFSDQILCWCHALSFMHNKSSFSIYSSVKKLYRSYTVVELLRLPLSLCSYICSSLSLSYFHHILTALATL